MADYTTSAYGGGNYGVTRRERDQRVTLVRYFDTSTYNLAATTVYEMFKYPANTLILKAYIITETVEGATATIDVVDDTSSTNTLISASTLNTDNTLGESSTHVFKAAAGSICVYPNHALDAAKFWLVVEYVALNTNM